MRKLGIILSAGKSSRLYPSTLATTKQLLPIYDKPLIFYPLTTLMLAGIRDFVIIVSPHEHDNFVRLFDNAEKEMGIKITFLIQHSPTGIAEAFNIVYHYLQDKIYDYDSHALILGDNIFYGTSLSGTIETIQKDKANVFLYPVKNPQEFGVAIVQDSTVIDIEEKPKEPRSNLAVTGLYFYPPSVYLYAKQLVPSARGELEITDLNRMYLKNRELNAINLLRGMVWFDTGNADSMLEASNFIQNVQKHQNYLVGSPHEIAINNEWVNRADIIPFIQKCIKTEYGQYLQKLI